MEDGRSKIAILDSQIFPSYSRPPAIGSKLLTIVNFVTTTLENATAMKYVGMRQLKTQLARYLRAVEAGDSLTVTVRNRPVAKVIPIQSQGKEAEDALNSLVEKGLLRPSKRKPSPVKRALKMRNARIAEAMLEDRGVLL
jgi:prevent-host-death family protein